MDTWANVEKWWWRIMRRLGQAVADLFIKMGITANQLTVARFWLLAPLVVYLYSRPGYWLPVLGFACLMLYGLLDFTDGTIAVKTGNTTLVGGWLDGRYDFMLQVCVLAGCVLHVVGGKYGQGWIAAGVAALFSQAVLVHHTDMFGGLFNNRMKFFEKMDELPLRGWEKLALDIVVTRSSVSILILTYRYWVLVFTLLGRLEWMLLGIAVTQTIRWVTLHLVMARLLVLRENAPGIWNQVWMYVNSEYTVPK